MVRMIIIDYSLEEVMVTRFEGDYKKGDYKEAAKSTSEQDMTGIEEANDSIK